MTRFYLFVIFLASVCFANAESKLHGAWKSDLKLTSDYLQKYANLSEHQKKAVNILFGKSMITFKPDGTGTITKESFTIPTKDGSQLRMSGSNSIFSYVLVGESEEQVVIKITIEDPTIEKHPFVMMKFQSKNVYSVEIGGNDFDLNGREFFQRSTADANKP